MTIRRVTSWVTATAVAIATTTITTLNEMSPNPTSRRPSGPGFAEVMPRA